MSQIIEVKNLSKSYGKLNVLRDLSFKINKGDVVLIKGPNGSGKTTLLRCLSLLEDFDSGEIIIGENKINCETTREKKEKIIGNQIIGFVFQELHPWNHMTVIENLIKPLTLVKKMPKDKAIKEAEKYLDLVGLLKKKDTYPYYLSGGQKRRLIIARTLVMNPEILLLDEITANLDVKLTKEIFSIIKKIAKEKTLIIVSHNTEMLKGIINKTIELD